MILLGFYPFFFQCSGFHWFFLPPLLYLCVGVVQIGLLCFHRRLLPLVHGYLVGTFYQTIVNDLTDDKFFDIFWHKEGLHACVVLLECYVVFHPHLDGYLLERLSDYFRYTLADDSAKAGEHVRKCEFVFWRLVCLRLMLNIFHTHHHKFLCSLLGYLPLRLLLSILLLLKVPTVLCHSCISNSHCYSTGYALFCRTRVLCVVL